MSIHFDPARWVKVKQDARQWWAGELDRPLFCLTAHGRSADRPPARHPFHHFTAFYDFSVTPEEIVDVWDYHLSRQRFLGDAFPTQWPNFGPGVAAGFLGAELLLDGRTVWFRPRQRQPLAELHFRFDAENPGCGG